MDLKLHPHMEGRFVLLPTRGGIVVPSYEPIPTLRNPVTALVDSMDYRRFVTRPTGQRRAYIFALVHGNKLLT